MKNFGASLLLLSLFWVGKIIAQPQAGRLEIRNYAFQDVNKKKVKLSDFKGKVVILDFWASWCQPCIASFSTTAGVMRRLEGEPVVLLTINTDQSKFKWKPALRQHKVPGIALYAKKKHPALKALDVAHLPKYLILDKNGLVYLYDAKSPYEEIETLGKLARE